MDAVLPVVERLSGSASFRESIEAALTSAIVSGELPPNTVVSVPLLAVQFGVSATPVREAILNLAKRGFVEPVRNKGFRITEVSQQDLEDIVQVRRWLEAPAMRIVAKELQGQELGALRELADGISQSAKRGDFHEYLTADTNFHRMLLQYTGNVRLVDMVTELRRQTRLTGLVNLKDTVELEISADEHYQLLGLLADGKEAEAEELMSKHIGHVVGWWAGKPEDATSDTDETRKPANDGSESA